MALSPWVPVVSSRFGLGSGQGRRALGRRCARSAPRWVRVALGPRGRLGSRLEIRPVLSGPAVRGWSVLRYSHRPRPGAIPSRHPGSIRLAARTQGAPGHLVKEATVARAKAPTVRGERRGAPVMNRLRWLPCHPDERRPRSRKQAGCTRPRAGRRATPRALAGRHAGASGMDRSGAARAQRTRCPGGLPPRARRPARPGPGSSHGFGPGSWPGGCRPRSRRPGLGGGWWSCCSWVRRSGFLSSFRRGRRRQG